MRRVVALLGVVTIAAYGSTFYAFGVLLEPVHADTGWSRGAIGAAYSVSLVLGGLGAAIGGRLLDAWGGRRVLVAGAVLGALPLGLAGQVDSAGAFVAVWGLGAGVVAATAFYHVTMVVTVRAAGGARASTFAALTFLGGLSSPIYLPLTAGLIERLGWRDAQLVLGASLAVVLVLAALALPAGSGAGRPASATAERLAEALRRPGVRVFVVATAGASLVGTVLNTYQVAAMQWAGLTLVAASGMAAVRGVASLPGRALLAPVVARLGPAGALAAAYAVMAVGTLALLAGGGGVTVYALTTGVAYGAVLPLQTLVGADLFDADRLGSRLGSLQAVTSVVSAAGPPLAGVVVDATGSFVAVIVVVSAGFAAAALGIRRTAASRPAAVRPVAGPASGG
ncbi:MAG TPA: MFS transporter [Acidimicrobiales bacterium]|nr:MFS transporter [Acidimicrobiales bacterium]